MRTRTRFALGAALAVAGAAFAVPALLRAPTRREPELREEPDVPPAGEAGEVLRVVSVNLAHGRGDGRHQLLRPADELRANLEIVGRLLADLGVDAVAVQEVDDGAWWTGGEDQLAAVARAGGLRWRVHGAHVDGLGLRYGTGVLARHPLGEPLAWTFAPSPPTPPKGFTRAVLRAPGWPEIELVSVHLDFLSPAARSSQVDELVEGLRGGARPLVVLGDLNAGWPGPAERLATALDLRAWRPEDEAPTFPRQGRRLDWVLAGRGVEIADQRVLPDAISDHRAVLVELRRSGAADDASADGEGAEE